MNTPPSITNTSNQGSVGPGNPSWDGVYPQVRVQLLGRRCVVSCHTLRPAQHLPTGPLACEVVPVAVLAAVDAGDCSAPVVSCRDERSGSDRTAKRCLAGHRTAVCWPVSPMSMCPAHSASSCGSFSVCPSSCIGGVTGSVPLVRAISFSSVTITMLPSLR